MLKGEFTNLLNIVNFYKLQDIFFEIKCENINFFKDFLQQSRQLAITISGQIRYS